MERGPLHVAIPSGKWPRLMRPRSRLAAPRNPQRLPVAYPSRLVHGMDTRAQDRDRDRAGARAGAHGPARAPAGNGLRGAGQAAVDGARGRAYAGDAATHTVLRRLPLRRTRVSERISASRAPRWIALLGDVVEAKRRGTQSVADLVVLALESSSSRAGRDV